MSLVRQAKIRQTVGDPLSDAKVYAFAPLAQGGGVAAASEDSRLVYVAPDGMVNVREYEIPGEDDFPVELFTLAALPEGGLLGAGIDAVRRLEPDGDKLRTVCAWDLQSRTVTANGVSVVADPSGSVMAAAAREYLQLLRGDGSAQTVREEEPYFRGLAASPDGRRLAVGRSDGSVELRSAADLAVEGTLSGLSAVVLALAFSPDGKHLAAADDKAKLAVWNLETGEASEIPGWTKIIGISWFSDSSGFAAAGLSRAVFLFDRDEIREPPFRLALDRFSPQYIQHAALADDRTLLLYVEENGIIPVRLGD
jgi:WD40 repeat protein